MKKFYYTKTDSGKIYLWSILTPQLLGAFFVLFLTLISNSEEMYQNLTKNIFIEIFITMLAQIAFLIVYFVYNRSINFKVASKINYNIGWKNILVCILIALIGVFGLNVLISSIDNFLIDIGYELSTSLPIPMDNFGWLVLNIILLAAVPAILEELIFRGVILNGYKNIGNGKAIIITSLLFALIHGSVQQFVFPFLFGLILGFVAIKTNTILAPMIVHFVNNALVVILNYVGFSFEIAIPNWALFIIGIVLVFVTFVLVWLAGKLLKNVDKKLVLSQEQLENYLAMEKAEVTSNMPIVIGVVIGVVFLILNLLGSMGVVLL